MLTSGCSYSRKKTFFASSSNGKRILVLERMEVSSEATSGKLFAKSIG